MSAESLLWTVGLILLANALGWIANVVALQVIRDHKNRYDRMTCFAYACIVGALVGEIFR